MSKNRLLVISVFVCGAVVMIFELAGSRLMAPYFGSSLYVWTGIIGIIMGSLSLGYWLGGRLADKNANQETYSQIIFFSALTVFWTMLVKDYVPALFQTKFLPVELGALLAALFLFAPASVLLGLVSPYAVRLKLVSMDTSASTVGNLYAASTVGSVGGTFIAGYFLIPFLGASNIFFLLFACLVVLSFAFSKKYLSLKIFIALVLTGSFVLIALTKSNNDRHAGIAMMDTEYNALKVFPGVQSSTGKPILTMAFDPFTSQSSMYKRSDDLVWNYSKYYRLAGHFVPNLKKALMIGGGAYSYPKDFIKQYPDATIEVVEIDPGITAAAKKYFRVPDNPRLITYNEDARSFINRSTGGYDAIFDDAFGSSFTTPFQLTTQEAVERQFAMLNDNGVVVANIGASLSGENGRFLRAEYATFKAVFPQVYLFPVDDLMNVDRVQNIMIVALKSTHPALLSSDNAEFESYLEHLWKKPVVNDMPILTDDYAPVEYYTKTII
jgi:predicted membrane-bound spermidine synthase